MNKDNLHYNTRKIDSYNRTYNFITSEREAGKSTAIWNKIYSGWYHHGYCAIVLRRYAIDITDVYISDIEAIINDFLPDNRKIKLEFKKGSIKEGIVDVKIKGKPFIRIIAMNPQKQRGKSLKYVARYIITDEFILDTAAGEKYLKGEVDRFKEIYNTFNRECARHYGVPMRCYFMGNPYSVFNPYYMWLDVDFTKIKPGAFIVGTQYVVECYQIKQELKDWILKMNPIYSFDEAYKKYAFNGEAVNDTRFRILNNKPQGYQIALVFRIQSKYVIYWKSGNEYWAEITDNPPSRTIYSVDFNNLITGTQLITGDDHVRFYRLKEAISNRRIQYQSVAIGYLTEDIYKYI